MEGIISNMFNKHFIRRLSFFVLILAVGAIVTVAVNYLDANGSGAATVDSVEE